MLRSGASTTVNAGAGCYRQSHWVSQAVWFLTYRSALVVGITEEDRTELSILFLPTTEASILHPCSQVQLPSLHSDLIMEK